MTARFRHSLLVFVAPALVATCGIAFVVRARPGAPHSLLLVSIDTVRADHVGAYGAASADTPSLDRLAASGVRFDEAVSAVPLTLPSHATILSGLTPPHHGLRNNGGGEFPKERATLATALSQAGYRTGAFIGAFVLDHRYGLSRGFDRYDDEIDRDPDSPAGIEAERPGAEVVDRAIEWLEKGDGRPFFAWVHLYDAHAPYDPPEPFRARHARDLYSGEVASVDFQVGRLLEWLDKKGLAKTTVVAVAADHGEALGEHGELTHGLLLYQATLRVPLLIKAPGLPAGRVVSVPVGLVDLAPTLAGILGHPLSGVDGRDLSRALEQNAALSVADIYSETEYPRQFGWAGIAALRRGPLKFIESPHEELYDLSKDAAEAKNLAPIPRKDLAQAIAAFRQGAVTATGAPDAEAAARLASLGYVGGSVPAGPSSSGRDPAAMVPLFRAFEEATWATNAGRLDDAASLLAPILGKDPGNPVFRSSLARVYRRRHDYPHAIALYREAIAAAPDDPDYRYDLALTLQEAGRNAEALEAIAQAVRRDDRRPEAHNALGISLFQASRLPEALSEFDRAAALAPRDARVQNNRGNVLKSMGRLDEAGDAYRRAAALSPRYPDPWNGLGTLEIQRDLPAAGLPDFDRALALAPDFHEARLNRAIAHELSGDAPAAAADYRQFLESAPDDAGFSRQRQVARQLLARLSSGARGERAERR